MGLKTSAFKALALTFALGWATTAAAEVPPLEKLNVKVRFDVTWNGLTIGRIRVKLSEDAFTYRMSVDTKTSGFARLFSEEKSAATAEGRVVDGDYVHTTYTSRNDNGSKQRTTIIYDERGNISTYERLPASKSKSRTPVPREEANTATDPVTAFFMLRRALHAAMKENARDVSVKSYDGVRLGQLSLHVASRARVEVAGKYEDAINTVIARKPIKGYSEKELKKFAEGDPAIHIFFSADGRFMPLKAQLQSGFGTIAATISEVQ